MKNHRASISNTYIYLIIGTVISLCAWELLSSQSSAFFFSKPSSIYYALVNGLSTGILVNDVLASAYSTIAGVFIGFVIGILLALLLVKTPNFSQGAEIGVAALASLPILAIAPLFLVWFGTGIEMKVAISVYLATILVMQSSIEARKTISSDWLAFKMNSHAKESRFIGRIYLPLMTEILFKRIPDVVNVSFLGTFIGEFIASDRGLGYRILRASSLYQVDLVLATALLSVFVLLLIQFLLKSGATRANNHLQRASVPSMFKQPKGE